MPTQITEHFDTPEQRQFRLKARSYMAPRLPPRRSTDEANDWQNKKLVEMDRQTQRMLWEGGLAGVTVPRLYGGLGLEQRYEDILCEEAMPYRLPWHFGNAFNIVLPTLLAHASEYLKTRYIGAMLRGEHIWCQLLSEPSGGSDLAGLLTRAERRDGCWILNGSKVWTSGGHESDMGICLARTDPAVPKHAGLTMFLVNMRAPGLTINPIKLVHGGSDFCQEFLDNVEVADDQVVGEVNGGWKVATTQLAAERAGLARGWHMGLNPGAVAKHLQLSQSCIEFARELGVAHGVHARQLIGEAFVIDVVSTLAAHRIATGTRNRTLSDSAGALSSLLAARTAARRTALLSELAGPMAVAVLPGNGGPAVGMDRVCTHRIGGGTAEMLCNVIAERFLDLPREPNPQRELPFNQLKHNRVTTASLSKRLP